MHRCRKDDSKGQSTAQRAMQINMLQPSTVRARSISSINGCEAAYFSY